MSALRPEPNGLLARTLSPRQRMELRGEVRNGCSPHVDDVHDLWGRAWIIDSFRGLIPVPRKDSYVAIVLRSIFTK